MANYIDIEQVVATFLPRPREDLQSRQMRHEADQLGKQTFFEAVPDARPASPTDVRRFIEGLGHKIGSRWIKLEVGDGVIRHVNVGWSNKAFDAFVGDRPAELKPTTENGISGLTHSEERLARMGLLDFYFIDLVGGLIGRARAEDIIAVPRRADGVPVGSWWLRWPSATTEVRPRDETGSAYPTVITARSTGTQVKIEYLGPRSWRAICLVSGDTVTAERVHDIWKLARKPAEWSSIKSAKSRT